MIRIDNIKLQHCDTVYIKILITQLLEVIHIKSNLNATCDAVSCDNTKFLKIID